MHTAWSPSTSQTDAPGIAPASFRWRPGGTTRSLVVITTAAGTSTWLIQLCEVNSLTA